MVYNHNNVDPAVIEKQGYSILKIPIIKGRSICMIQNVILSWLL